ncbi:MAG: hypothetical protein J5724_05575 [Ruminococcus sp.]|uniref:hypothetical protein n=1 Tax=Ruminococcus sp. TaxID=41978 RepID=UPI001B608EE1|nr:hypothetical protein [Ruminococcus sp.]MBO4493841.1 hypothetical protein [Ruminococcus sp.]MBP5432514.1 hypothetical protein [Ruminococcus sp.]
MFDNAGKKLKITAKVLFWVIAIVGTINGIIAAEDTATGLLMIPFSIFAAWVAGLSLYAFGDMCENLDLIRSNMYIVASVTEKRFPDLAEEDPADKVVADDGEDQAVNDEH